MIIGLSYHWPRKTQANCWIASVLPPRTITALSWGYVENKLDEMYELCCQETMAKLAEFLVDELAGLSRCYPSKQMSLKRI